jgi:hypothetical protein
MTNSKLLRTMIALLVITLSISGLMSIALLRQFVKSPDMPTWPWQSVLEATGTSLLAGGIAAGLAVYCGMSGSSFIQENVRTILSSRTRIVFFAIVLLAFVLPAVLSLFSGALLSPGKLAVYTRELWLSVTVLASATATLRILTRRISRSRELVLLGQAASKVAAIQNQRGIELRQVQEMLGKALIALEQGRIDQDQAREIEQTTSLTKWILQNDDTGWYELREEACFGNGLTASIRVIVEQELQRVSQEEISHDQVCWNSEYEKRLQSLLSPQQA